MSAALDTTVGPLAAEPLAPLGHGRGRRGRVALWSGVAILALALCATVVVRVLHLGSPNAPDYAAALQAPSLDHLFGTDALGRDVFVRCVYATLTDFKIAILATAAPLVLGLAIGGVAGYVGGWLGAAIDRVMEILQAFPALVLILLIVAIAGPGITNIFIAIVIAQLPDYVRLTRGEMLVLREQQFIMAAQTLGFPTRRIVFRHALPHLVRPALVVSLSALVSNVLLLAALSFLGLGVQPPTPEWGAIIADGQTYLLTSWWIATLPGLFLVVVGLGISLTGEAVADRLRIHVTGRA